MLDAADIRQAVEMTAILVWYGLEPNRAGFISCPFHADKTPSLKIYPSGRGWHCFSCERGGSVIDFVMAMEGKTFQEACQLIEERTGLEGYTHEPVRYRRHFKSASVHDKKESIRQQYQKALEILKAPHDDFDEELTWACKNIAHLEYLMENLDEYE